jgi:hypothetical protein
MTLSILLGYQLGSTGWLTFEGVAGFEQIKITGSILGLCEQFRTRDHDPHTPGTHSAHGVSVRSILRKVGSTSPLYVCIGIFLEITIQLVDTTY